MDVSNIENDEQLTKLFMNILETEDIYTTYQPIVSLQNGALIGFEVLSRGRAGSSLESPDLLFEMARKCGKVKELDALCRKVAVRKINQKDEFLLFINVDAEVVFDMDYHRKVTIGLSDNHTIHSEKLVFEIINKSDLENNEAFQKVLEVYKKRGFKVAVNEIGVDATSISIITDLRPDFIKLNMALVRGIHLSQKKYKLVKTLFHFCNMAGISIIAEGIECKEEIEALMEIGVPYGQGYYIGKPSKKIRPINPEVQETIVLKRREISEYTVTLEECV